MPQPKPKRAPFDQVVSRNEAYLENGPLHGRVIALKDLHSMSRNNGIYMRDDNQVMIN